MLLIDAGFRSISSGLGANLELFEWEKNLIFKKEFRANTFIFKPSRYQNIFHVCERLEIKNLFNNVNIV